jgi:hypothetical protein
MINPQKLTWKKVSFTSDDDADQFAAFLVREGFKTYGNRTPRLRYGQGFHAFTYGSDIDGVKRLIYTPSRNCYREWSAPVAV